MMPNYTVDIFKGRITLKRNGVTQRKSGAWPKCYCCHPNDPLWKEPERTFNSVEEAWRAADYDRQKVG